MAKAKTKTTKSAVATTTPKSTPPADQEKRRSDALRWDAKLADAYRDIESEVNEMHHMCTLTVDAFDNIFSDYGAHEQITKNKDCFYVPESQREAALFAVYHLQDMIAGLVEKYDATFEDLKA